MIWTVPFIVGILSLAHGQGWASKSVLNIAWGGTIGGATWFLLFGSLGAGWPLAILSVIAGIISLAGKAAAHGTGMGLDNQYEGKLRLIERPIKWLNPYLGDYWYKVLILSTSGLAAVSGAVLAVGWIDVASGFAIALSGLLKGPGYMFGQWLEDQKALLRIYKMFRVRIYSNQIGEFLAGFFSGCGLAFANILI